MKNVFWILHRLKNIHGSKLYLYHTDWNKFFVAATFFESFKFGKHIVYFGLYESSLDLVRGPNKYCFWGVNLISYT